MIRPIRLYAGFLTVGVWTLASRVLGFVRDIMIAGALGAGPVAEAFLIAFSLPNMFRRFFAEGAFSMAFVPMFSKRLQAGGDARAFAADALSGLGALLIGFTLIAQAAMPLLVLAMASGFAADERLDLAVLYGRIAFPYILFISLAALLSGVLNATGRFTAALLRTSLDGAPIAEGSPARISAVVFHNRAASPAEAFVPGTLAATGQITLIPPPGRSLNEIVRPGVVFFDPIGSGNGEHLHLVTSAAIDATSNSAFVTYTGTDLPAGSSITVLMDSVGLAERIVTIEGPSGYTY